jgi:hypothetical protein
MRFARICWKCLWLGVLGTMGFLHCADAVAAAPAPVPLQTELDPAYFRWCGRPGEMYGFWMAGDEEETAQRTGANACTLHRSMEMWLESVDGKAIPHVLPTYLPPRQRVRMGFQARHSFRAVRVLLSTAETGAAGTVTLFRNENGIKQACGSMEQSDAASDGWVTLTRSEPFAAGNYILEMKPQHGRVEVWPGPAADAASWLEDPLKQPERQTGIALDSELLLPDGTTQTLRRDDTPREYITLQAAAKSAALAYGLGLGEHNNPFFIVYPRAFEQAYPEAFMRDTEGKPIRLHADATGHANPVPAVDDATLTTLGCAMAYDGARFFANDPLLRYRVIAGEMAYPDYFNLPAGDFRPASLAHFKQFLALRGWNVPVQPSALTNMLPTFASAAWVQFREHALADRAALYMQSYLRADASRPVLYPLHGNPFFSYGRRTLGHPPELLAGACDGFETGQIMIDEDAERLNFLTLAHLTGFGKPVVTPRLGNKTLDAAALGGGRSFSPPMLRRFIYECLGLGVWHIGLVQWVGDLPDGEWHIKGTPAEAEARRVFGELNTLAPLLAGMGRLQPRVGLLAAESTWRQSGWPARWSGFVQDALARQWNLSIVSETVLSAELAQRVPLLISLDNEAMSRAGLAGMQAYLAAGGSLIRCGEFAHYDELHRAYQANETEAVMQHSQPCTATAVQPERVLTNACSTGSGAHTELRTYTPVPFDEIERLTRAVVGEGAWGAVRLEGGAGNVEPYTLTDGETLLVLLVNRANTTQMVRVRLTAGLGAAQDWEVQTMAAGQFSAPQRLAERTAWEIGAQDVVALWLARPAAVSQAQQAVQQAETALTIWRSRGVDVASAEALLKGAVSSDVSAYPAKQAALTRAVLNMAGVAVNAARQADGGLQVQARVYDAQGAPLEADSVMMQFTPGTSGGYNLPKTSAGIYQLKLMRSQLPQWYAPQRAQYEPLHGAARVEVRVRCGARQGAAFFNLGEFQP